MEDYPFFPVFVDLSGRRALVVGGGRIAARRVNTLSQFCPNVTVVAPSIHPDIAALAARGRVKTVARPYREEDLDGAELVLACTDDGALNAAVAEACRERRIPVNDASDRSRCDFLFPGIARRSPVVAGVTAGGRDHALARRATEAVRRCLERELDDDD
ncbi:MAG: bifunctional precorrin-2 dehydrogenase/sirohydrochlorin ferrochelatase [Clostridia bacterium]|nr:bifunctional precorrin-2 dehydrogenase/sirohydrochlorin ferrochelatase [Clostridia bacterium]